MQLWPAAEGRVPVAEAVERTRAAFDASGGGRPPSRLVPGRAVPRTLDDHVRFYVEEMGWAIVLNHGIETLDVHDQYTGDRETVTRCLCWKPACCDDPGKHIVRGSDREMVRPYTVEELRERIASYGNEAVSRRWDDGFPVQRRLEPFVPYPEFNLPNVSVNAGLSGLALLDVDLHNEANNGTETLAALESRFGRLPRTVQDRTGNRRPGTHYYFSTKPGDLPPGTKFGDSYLGAGLELIVEWPYPVIPPSMHAHGNPYTWVHAPWDVAVAPLPAWVSDLLWEKYGGRQEQREQEQREAAERARESARRAYSLGGYAGDDRRVQRARAFVATIEGAASKANGGGGRHLALFGVACKLVEFDLSADEARPILEEWNARCNPPQGQREVEDALRNSANKAVRGKKLHDDRPRPRYRRRDDEEFPALPDGEIILPGGGTIRLGTAPPPSAPAKAPTLAPAPASPPPPPALTDAEREQALDYIDAHPGYSHSSEFKARRRARLTAKVEAGDQFTLDWLRSCLPQPEREREPEQVSYSNVACYDPEVVKREAEGQARVAAVRDACSKAEKLWQGKFEGRRRVEAQDVDWAWRERAARADRHVAGAYAAYHPEEPEHLGDCGKYPARYATCAPSDAGDCGLHLTGDGHRNYRNCGKIGCPYCWVVRIKLGHLVDARDRLLHEMPPGGLPAFDGTNYKQELPAREAPVYIHCVRGDQRERLSDWSRRYARKHGVEVGSIANSPTDAEGNYRDCFVIATHPITPDFTPCDPFTALERLAEQVADALPQPDLVQFAGVWKRARDIARYKEMPPSSEMTEKQIDRDIEQAGATVRRYTGGDDQPRVEWKIPDPKGLLNWTPGELAEEIAGADDAHRVWLLTEYARVEAIRQAVFRVLARAGGHSSVAEWLADVERYGQRARPTHRRCDSAFGHTVREDDPVLSG